MLGKIEGPGSHPARKQKHTVFFFDGEVQRQFSKEHSKGNAYRRGHCELFMESMMNGWLPVILKPSILIHIMHYFNFFLFTIQYYRVWISEYVLVHTV